MNFNQEEPQKNNHCQFFLVRKKRFCRMIVKKDHKYCGEHQPVTEQELPESRIICPLDSTHTCYAHKLKQHLKICNAKVDVIPSYIQYGINKEGDNDLNEEADNEKLKLEENEEAVKKRDAEEVKRNLNNVKKEIIDGLIAKVEQIYQEIAGEVEDSSVSHAVLAEELANPSYGCDTRKHLLQNSSLLGILQKYNLLESNSCFVEFGGGKGKLSFWLSKASEQLTNTKVVLVDKASHRHKQDNKCREHVVRIKADIQDLVLNNVDVIAETENVVGVAKHLCGAATDLALKCIESVHKMHGLVFAFCCHHRCHWGPYKGKEFFTQRGLSHEDFDTMCGLVSWATCGHAEKSKVEIGKKCKLILNWGRLLYLKDRGFHCRLLRYVPEEVSLENVCIVAYK